MVRFGVFLFITILVALIVSGCTHNSITPSNNIATPFPSVQWIQLPDTTYSKTLVVTRNGHMISNGQFISTDTGYTFTSIPLDPIHLATAYHMSMIVGPNGELYENGFYSLDDGATWNNVPNNNYYLALVPGTPNKLYGTSANQLHVSTDNGLTWSTSSISGASSTTSIYAAAISPNIDRLYVGTLTGFMQSATSGQTWSNVLPVGTGNPGIKCINVLPVNDLLVGTNNGELYRGTSQASVFTRIFQADTLNPIVYTVISANGYLFMGTWGGGVYVSNDNGARWGRINTGLTNMYVQCLLYYGDYLFAGTSHGMFRTRITAAP